VNPYPTNSVVNFLTVSNEWNAPVLTSSTSIEADHSMEMYDVEDDVHPAAAKRLSAWTCTTLTMMFIVLRQNDSLHGHCAAANRLAVAALRIWRLYPTNGMLQSWHQVPALKLVVLLAASRVWLSSTIILLNMWNDGTCLKQVIVII
jgi:hypothetical protein